MNSFGLWRDYPNRPTTDPDAMLTIDDLYNRHNSQPSPSNPTSQSSDLSRASYGPFLSETVHSIMKWLNNGNTSKSEAEKNRFVYDVILSASFHCEDLVGFDAHRENQRLDKSLKKSALQSHFVESSIDILVPSGNISIQPKHFTVPGLLHRKLTSVICEAFESPLAYLYHFSPFKLSQKSPLTGTDERVYGEIYTSDAFLAEAEDVRLCSPLPPDDADCRREKIFAALMFSSDATILTDFGTAKAWPIYLMLGNLSKYLCAQTDSGAMHHLAYIPSVCCFRLYPFTTRGLLQLPESFKEFASSFHSKWRTQKQQIFTHCRCELMHMVWSKLLDDDFVHAYTYGIVIKCIDGIERRVYPRLFTYSADYPEK